MKYFGYTLFAIGVVNFASFWIIALIIGGDAVGSGPIDGRYYVSEHGRQTEVSRSVFEYSWYHARSVWVTHPLAAFGWYIVYCEDKKRKAESATQPPEPSAVDAAISASRLISLGPACLSAGS